MSDKEARFGEKVIKLGFATPGQVEECLQVQRRMSDMGVQDGLGTILLKKKYINQHQMTEVLKAMGLQVQPIPGYQMLGKVGRGGMGEVYRARQQSMDRVVALKILSSKATESKNFVERFFKEAQAAAKLNHKAIIQAYDAGCANGIYYFAMEFVDGVTVQEVVRKEGPFPEKKALEITAQVCDALAYIHKHRLIHRDIKPENLLLMKNGEVKICDFGLAKSQVTEDSTQREGYTIGTPYYMSPEQISGRKDLDIRSDLYSLGATIFYMLTGRHVFQGKDIKAVMSQHLTTAAPAPSSLAKGVSSGTDAIVAKMLRKARDNRYADPELVAQDLRCVIQGASPENAGVPKQSRTPIVAAVSVAAVLLLVVIIALVAGGGDEETPEPEPELVQQPEEPVGPEPELEPEPEAEPEPEERLEPEPLPDEGELQAERAFAMAENARQELKARQARGEDRPEDWDRLEQQYKALERDFASTEFFGGHRRQVWDLMVVCRESAVSAGRRIREAKETAAADLRKSFEEAKTLMQGGQWADGRERLIALLAQALPPELSKKEIDRLAKACDREIEAEQGWAEVRTAAQSPDWKVLQEKVQAFEKEYRKTATLKAKKGDLDAYKALFAGEQAAAKALEDLRAAVKTDKWKKVPAGLKKLREKHANTATLRESEEELKGYEAELAKRAREPIEAMAKKTWENALTAMEGGDYRAASGLLLRLEQEPFSTTEFVAGIGPEIGVKKGEVAERLAEQAEKLAKEMYSKARRDLREGRVEDALPLYKALAEDKIYAETSTLKKSARSIARDYEKCAKEYKKFAASLITGFEGGIKRWASHADGRKGKIELQQDPYTGRNAGKISFSRHKGKWAYLEYPLEGAPREAFGISFYAKSADKKFQRVRIMVRQGRDGNQALFVADREVGPKWSYVRFTWSEFKMYWYQNKKAPPPRFNPFEIRTIEFSQITPDWSGSYLIDRIRYEVR